MGGWVKVDLKHVDKDIVISVTDNGCGISNENLERIGEPFFTTKKLVLAWGFGNTLYF